MSLFEVSYYNGHSSGFCNFESLEQNIQETEPSRLDKISYVPIIGSFSGAGRIGWGVVKAAFCSLLALGSRILTGSPGKWSALSKDGLKHIGRGIVELFPYVGGKLTESYDRENPNYDRYFAIKDRNAIIDLL